MRAFGNRVLRRIFGLKDMVKVKKMVKISLLQAMETHRVARG
jgi:hypothetical protein